MLHLKNDFGRRMCRHCGEQLTPELVNGQYVDPANSTTDEQAWADNPENCGVMKPVTMALFDDENFDPQWSGFRFQNDRIQIDEERLKMMLASYTALIMKNGELYRFELPPTFKGYYNTSFLWEPKIIGAPVRVEEIAVSPTFHGCGYHAFFKPSISEVLAQVPTIAAAANAFWIESNRVRICQDGEGHIAPTHWVRIIE